MKLRTISNFFYKFTILSLFYFPGGFNFVAQNDVYSYSNGDVLYNVRVLRVLL